MSLLWYRRFPEKIAFNNEPQNININKRSVMITFHDIATQVLFSLAVVALIHYIYNYLKEQYTTKKHRDVGRTFAEKYETLFQELKPPKNSTDFVGVVNAPNALGTNVQMEFIENQNKIDCFLPEKEAQEMQSSLVNFVLQDLNLNLSQN
jgi:hypothetical protein